MKKLLKKLGYIHQSEIRPIREITDKEIADLKRFENIMALYAKGYKLYNLSHIAPNSSLKTVYKMALKAMEYQEKPEQKLSAALDKIQAAINCPLCLDIGK